jgi:hypothetical protein
LNTPKASSVGCHVSATVQEDSNGNVTDDGTYLHAYDAFNRLIAVRLKSTGLLKFQYFYDTAGERAATIPCNASGTSTSFTHWGRGRRLLRT